VIADLVGDNVGDCAARGADLFESIAAEVISAMILGGTMAKKASVSSVRQLSALTTTYARANRQCHIVLFCCIENDADSVRCSMPRLASSLKKKVHC
jgi:Na+/H+-translocating membrane pyrophosphatase